jgi:hypothetical protein
MRLVTVVVLAAACSSPPAPPPPGPAEAPATAPEVPEAPEDAGPIPTPWAAERLRAAERRMAASEGGRLVARAIEAHGGLLAWYEAGTVELEFDYAPRSGEDRRHTFQRLDLWRARAHHEEVDGDATFGWDGEEAWIAPDAEAFPSPARFWALTPHYFFAIPFVLADEGVRYEVLEDAAFDGVDHRLVKITYEAGTGDAPDDYYVVYLHPETHRVAALRYVVSYPGFFPEGGHTPEKLMRYEALEEEAGLLVPHALPTFAFDAVAGTIGERVTDITITRVRFGETYPAALFARPEGAAVSPL